jgi:hypothetical protein
MTIAFLHPRRAFLPEIDAYTRFFGDCGIKTISNTAREKNLPRADVEWRLMGSDFNNKKKETVIIHEYGSCSMPPFQKLKDLSKKWFNAKPDYRLFLNNYVKEQFRFTDNIPFGLRDMGIYAPVQEPEKNKGNYKEYDFIYAGSAGKERKLGELINCFTKKEWQGHSFLILSRDYKELAEKYKSFPSILFKGPLSHPEAQEQISKAKFAINYTPSREPFSQQTSTKILEYAVLRIPIITTEYQWVKEFQSRYGGNFFFLSKDLSNFSWQRVNGFDYSFPELKEWTWEKQIRKSGVLEFLESRFPGLHF